MTPALKRHILAALDELAAAVRVSLDEAENSSHGISAADTYDRIQLARLSVARVLQTDEQREAEAIARLQRVASIGDGGAQWLGLTEAICSATYHHEDVQDWIDEHHPVIGEAEPKAKPVRKAKRRADRPTVANRTARRHAK